MLPWPDWTTAEWERKLHGRKTTEHGTPGEPNYPHAKGNKAAGRPHTPDTRAQADANAYAKTLGLPPITHAYAEVDQQRAGRIADAYDEMPADDRANPAVARAYRALGTEVQAQWDFAIGQGMTFTPWTKAGQPYATSSEMAADVAMNRHLYFFQGGEPHPLLAAPDTSGLSLNDKFRAIHDYYEHAAGGFGFGPRGEENAWLAHSQMFSREARKAMTTETRGQNSWVNFGRHNYDAAGNYKHIPVEKRPYAQQKVALLPEEFWGMTNTKEAAKPVDLKRRAGGETFVRKPAKLPEEAEMAYRRRPSPPKKK